MTERISGEAAKASINRANKIDTLIIQSGWEPEEAVEALCISLANVLAAINAMPLLDISPGETFNTITENFNRMKTNYGH